MDEGRSQSPTGVGWTDPKHSSIARRLESLLPALSDARDLLRGLFGLPAADAPRGCDYADTIEERYSKPRRCC